ncbi:MAG: F0F1 ATP synthase subunit epsilon [Gammaproteobacteria bacterium]|nr:F0F1 ATP synthase subunit epsilon [Gammaproteobacteria bacterium]
MANTIRVEVVSAEGHMFDGDAEMVVAAATQGEVGVAAGHAPFISPLRPGDIRIINDGDDEQHFYVSGGVIEVQPKLITILADTAVRASDLDEAEIVKAKERAEALIKDRNTTVDLATAQSELVELAAQLQAIRKLKKTR